MATTLLRTLTLKSPLKFGRHADLTVNSMLNLNNHDRLAWYYYNMSMISFTNEVLLLIGIDYCERIEKPGINKEKFNEWKRRFYNRLSKLEFDRLQQRNKEEAKHKLIFEERLNNRAPSSNQSRSQGKRYTKRIKTS